MKQLPIFFKQALANIKQTGSLIPSSAFLAAKMVEKIDFKKDLNIFELGAGEGIFTRRILAEMNPKSSLTSYEINPQFFNEIAKIKDNRLHQKMESVFDRRAYDNFAKCSVDYIISGIPLANMEKKDKQYLLDSCFSLLKPGGLFVQFQYLPRDYKLIEKTFGNLKFGFTLFNFPPAFVYYAFKPLAEKQFIKQEANNNVFSTYQLNSI